MVLTTLAILVAASNSWPARARAGAQPPAPALSSEEFVARVAAGEVIDLVGAVVEGDVDLRAAGTITGPLRCQSCRITGSLNAADVIFDRVVDLRDSTVEGALELRGTVFRDHAAFGGVRVHDRASVASARFLRDGSFRQAHFNGESVFDQMEVEGRAFFQRVTFSDHASFRSATFDAAANFAQCRFLVGANFDDAVFEGPANFFLVEFEDSVSFEDVEFDAGGSFRLVRFRRGAMFDRVNSGESLNFDAAVLQGDVSFTNLTSSGSLSLAGILLQRSQLFMEQLSVEDFAMDVSAISAVRGPREQILELIESSAKARGDLALANDARYELLSLHGKQKSWLARGLDTVLYRGVAGYLVRPSHPLVAFLVLLMASALVRAAPALRDLASAHRPELPRRSRSGRTGVVDRSRRDLLDVQKGVVAVLGGLAAGLAVAVHRKPEIEIAEADRDQVRAYFVAALKALEFLAYKLLIILFLLALGNSSATIREVIDTVRQ